MPTYYELMAITRREITEEMQQEEFESGDELDEIARKGEIDSESQTVATALGIIHWLLKNDETVKGKYVLKKKAKEKKKKLENEKRQ